MLPKKNRVTVKEVDLIFKEGIFSSSPNLSFRHIKTGNSETKISFIAPKSVAKLAVKRNLLRRMGYLALQDTKRPPGLMGIFVFKKYQDDVAILENEIKNIFDKIN